MHHLSDYKYHLVPCQSIASINQAMGAQREETISTLSDIYIRPLPGPSLLSEAIKSTMTPGCKIWTARLLRGFHCFVENKSYGLVRGQFFFVSSCPYTVEPCEILFNLPDLDILARWRTFAILGGRVVRFMSVIGIKTVKV